MNRGHDLDTLLVPMTEAEREQRLHEKCSEMLLDELAVMLDGPTVLVSDADREQAVQALKVAHAEGRLTAAEHEHRVTAALTARTDLDLRAALAQLPAAAPASPDAPADHVDPRFLRAASLPAFGLMCIAAAYLMDFLA